MKFWREEKKNATTRFLKLFLKPEFLLSTSSAFLFASLTQGRAPHLLLDTIKLPAPNSVSTALLGHDTLQTASSDQQVSPHT